MNKGLEGGTLLFLELDCVFELPDCFLVAYFEALLLRQLL